MLERDGRAHGFGPPARRGRSSRSARTATHTIDRHIQSHSDPLHQQFSFWHDVGWEGEAEVVQARFGETLHQSVAGLSQFCHWILGLFSGITGCMNSRTFDHLIERLRSLAAALPDRRTGDNTRFSMADIALAAFSVFFTQCPSFLSYQRGMEQARGRNNARSLFQVERIPSDNHIRQTLDPVAPLHLFSLFDDLHRAFDQAGLLEQMRAVQRTRLIALDATWYFSSQSKNVCCPNCSCIQHADGQTTHFHSAITPVIVSPGHSQVVPLRPEFITPQDGQVKQDCEINAAKRWLAAHAEALLPPATTRCWATIFTPINPSAGRCCCTGFISCSPASPLPMPRCTSGWKVWKRAASCTP